MNGEESASKTATASGQSPANHEPSWWEMSDAQLKHHLVSQVARKPLNLHAQEIEQLLSKMQESLKIIETVLDTYKCVSLSYNGGKDSVVLLNLVQWALHRRNGNTHSQSETLAATQQVLVFHICEKNNFPEIEAFIRDSDQRYGMQTVLLDGSFGFKTALVELCEQSPTVDAVFIGLRKSDPSGSDQGFFERTSADWPQMMRVNPILMWSYRDVWAFLIVFQVSYCSLYDLGYTSLGCVHNTQKNPFLLQPDGSHLPAYMLKDVSKERESRLTSMSS